MSTAVKVTMNLTQDNASFIERLSDTTGTNKTTLVNHAISLERIVREAKKNGGRIIIEDANGSSREIVII